MVKYNKPKININLFEKESVKTGQTIDASALA